MREKKDDSVIQSSDKISDFSRLEGDGIFITFDPRVFSTMSPDEFTAKYWQVKGGITGFAKGRGTTWFFQHQDHQLVLRHYYRGGMVSKFLNDAYLFTGLENCRAYREFVLLAILRQRGLPVPAPVAYKVEKKALFFCVNDIITSRIDDTDSLAAILSLRQIDDAIWRKVGKTVRELHDHNVFHHDLNAHNILIDANNKVWLIDFDQGELREDTAQWKKENLQRLKRSLIKEHRLNPAFHFHEADWQKLIRAYHA